MYRCVTCSNDNGAAAGCCVSSRQRGESHQWSGGTCGPCPGRGSSFLQMSGHASLCACAQPLWSIGCLGCVWQPCGRGRPESPQRTCRSSPHPPSRSSALAVLRSDGQHAPGKWMDKKTKQIESNSWLALPMLQSTLINGDFTPSNCKRNFVFWRLPVVARTFQFDYPVILSMCPSNLQVCDYKDRWKIQLPVQAHVYYQGRQNVRCTFHLQCLKCVCEQIWTDKFYISCQHFVLLFHVGCSSSQMTEKSYSMEATC